MLSKILTKKSTQNGSEEQLEKLKKILQEDPDNGRAAADVGVIFIYHFDLCRKFRVIHCVFRFKYDFLSV